MYLWVGTDNFRAAAHGIIPLHDGVGHARHGTRLAESTKNQAGMGVGIFQADGVLMLAAVIVGLLVLITTATLWVLGAQLIS